MANVSFDDLIPKQQNTPASPQGAGISFDDLVPKTVENKPEAPFLSRQFFEEGMLGRVAKGVGERTASFVMGQTPQQKADMQRLYGEDEFSKLKQSAEQGLSRIVNDPLGVATDIGTAVKQTAIDMVNNPGKTTVGFLKSLVQDPEFLLVGSLGAVNKAGALTAKMNKAAQISAKTLASGAEGAALMAGGEFAAQTAETKPYDPVAIGTQAVVGGAFGGVIHGAKEAYTTIRGNKATNTAVPKADEIKPPGPDATQTEKEAYVEHIKARRQRVMESQPIVETAIRNKNTGEIERMGPKHDEQRKEETKDTHEQGFMDAEGNFLTREEAYQRALKTGMLDKTYALEFPDDGLHSGDLRAAGHEAFQLTDEQKAGISTENKAPVTREEHKKALTSLDKQIDKLSDELAIAEYSNNEPLAKSLHNQIKELEKQSNDLRQTLPAATFADKLLPTWEEMHDHLWGIKDVGQAIDSLIKADVGGKGQKILLKHLSKFTLVKDATISTHPDFIEYVNALGEKKKNASGLYDNNIHHITIGKKGNLQTFLHEAIHAGTTKAIYEGNLKVVKSLEKILKVYQDRRADEFALLLQDFQQKNPNATIKELTEFKEKQEIYALTNVLELVAESFTDVNTLDWMKNTPSNSKKPLTKLNSLWNSFKQAVYEAVEANPETRSSIDDVLEHGVELLQRSEGQYRKDGVTGATSWLNFLNNPNPAFRKEQYEEDPRRVQEKIGQKSDLTVSFMYQPPDYVNVNGELKLVPPKEIRLTNSYLSVIAEVNKKNGRNKGTKEDFINEVLNSSKGWVGKATPKEVVEQFKKDLGEWWDTREAQRMSHRMSDGKTKTTQAERTAKVEQMSGASKQTLPSTPSVEGGEATTERLATEPVPVPEQADIKSVRSWEDLVSHGERVLFEQGEEAAAKFFDDFKEFQKTWGKQREGIDKLVGDNLQVKAADERLNVLSNKEIKKIIQTPEQNNLVRQRIETGTVHLLPDNLRAAAERFKADLKSYWERANAENVIQGYIENYFPHMLNWVGGPENVGAKPPSPTAMKELINSLMGKEESDGASNIYGMDTGTKRDLRRSLETIEDLNKFVDQLNKRIQFAYEKRLTEYYEEKDRLEKEGKYPGYLEEPKAPFKLEVKTDNIVEAHNIYTHAISKAIANKKFMEGMRDLRDAQGNALMIPIEDGKMPHGWKQIDSPQLAGMAIHPDLVPSLQFLFDAGPGQWMKAALNVSQAVKRFNVIGSFFHAKSLLEVLSSAKTPIWSPLYDGMIAPLIEQGARMFGKEIRLSAISKALDAYRTAEFGDSTDRWIGESGLVLETPEDVKAGVLTNIGKVADDLIAKFGPRTRVLEKSMTALEKVTLGAFDHYTWDYLHTGIKLHVAESYLAKQKENAAKSGQPFDEVKARKEIASFMNNAAGGLNWYQAATEAQTEFGRRIAMAAYSPQGRRAMQTLLFAPDWTLSTLRSFTSALPDKMNPTKWQPVKGIKGMITPTTKADYARLYQFKTALTYLTVINAFNMMTANRPVWENKDPTRIEWPDGTSMQAMKHAMEPYHWIFDPDKTLSNKLGFIPKTLWVGLAGTEYASPLAQKIVPEQYTGNANIDEYLSRAKVIAKSLAPFQAQAFFNAPEGEGTKRAVLGTMGFPVYGKNEDQRKVEKEDRKLRAQQNAWNYHQKEIDAGRESNTKAHQREKKRIEREKVTLERKKAKLQ